jgi:rhodanese-related sulfurtransferase
VPLRHDGRVHPTAVPTLTPSDVAPTDLLLDVREDDEWSWGRAPEAVHVPLYDVPGRADALPRDRRVAVVCRVGSRSAQAVAYLRSLGVDARNVEGGMLAWQARGLPLVGDAEPPRVL